MCRRGTVLVCNVNITVALKIRTGGSNVYSDRLDPLARSFRPSVTEL